MAIPTRRAVAALVPLYAALTNAVALSDFTPSLSNVPDPCDSVYANDIDGCTMADFSSGCSQSCINGLVSINQQVNAACSDFNAPSGSLLDFFKQGQGIQVLCHVAVITASSASIGQSTMVLPSSMATSSSLLYDTSSMPQPQTSTTSSSTSLTTQQTSATAQQTVAIPPSSSSSSSSTSTSAAPTAQSQSSGNDGTGGDPFAIGSSAPSIKPLCTLLGLPLTLAIVAIFSL